MDTTSQNTSQPAGPFRSFLPQHSMPSPSGDYTAPYRWKQSWSSPQGTVPSTVSTSRSSSQRPPSTLGNSVVTHADARLHSIPSGSSSTGITFPIPSDHAGYTLGIQLSGPSPEWAYFYDPPLSLSQVEFVQELMKSEEEYLSMHPSAGQDAMVSDLRDALSAMRRVFNRSTDVRGASGARCGATPTSVTTAKPTQPLPGHGRATTENAASVAIVISSDDEDTVENFEVEDVDHSSFTTASQSRPRQMIQSQPVHNLARMSANQLHGKRASSGDDVLRKRQRTFQGDDLDIATHKGTISPKTAQDLSGAKTPGTVKRNVFFQDAQDHTPNLIGNRFSSERLESVPAANGSRQTSNEIQMPTSKKVRRLKPTDRAEESMESSSLRQDAGTSAVRSAIHDDTGGRRKQRGRMLKLRHPEGFLDDLDGRPYHLVRGMFKHSLCLLSHS